MHVMRTKNSTVITSYVRRTHVESYIQQLGILENAVVLFSEKRHFLIARYMYLELKLRAKF